MLFELLCAMSSNMDEQLCNNLKKFLSCLDEILPSSSTVKKWCTYYSKLITTMHSACMFVESRNMIQSFNCDGSSIKGISFEAFMLTTRSNVNVNFNFELLSDLELIHYYKNKQTNCENNILPQYTTHILGISEVKIMPNIIICLFSLQTMIKLACVYTQ